MLYYLKTTSGKWMESDGFTITQDIRNAGFFNSAKSKEVMKGCFYILEPVRAGKALQAEIDMHLRIIKDLKALKGSA